MSRTRDRHLPEVRRNDRRNADDKKGSPDRKYTLGCTKYPRCDYVSRPASLAETVAEAT